MLIRTYLGYLPFEHCPGLGVRQVRALVAVTLERSARELEIRLPENLKVTIADCGNRFPDAPYRAGGLFKAPRRVAGRWSAPGIVVLVHAGASERDIVQACRHEAFHLAEYLWGCRYHYNESLAEAFARNALLFHNTGAGPPLNRTPS